jgi:hypothetical protein
MRTSNIPSPKGISCNPQRIAVTDRDNPAAGIISETLTDSGTGLELP